MEKELEQSIIDVVSELNFVEDADPFAIHGDRSDPRDKFDIKTLAQWYNADTNTEVLENNIIDTLYDGYYEEELQYRDAVMQALQDNGIDTHDSEVEDWVIDNITYYAPINDYLSDEYDCEIFINTGDVNTDFYDNPTNETIGDLHEVDDLSDTASLVWLAQTQGYSKEDLFNALVNQEFKGSRFLRSVYDECINGWGAAQLVFLVKMSIKRLTQGAPYSVPKNVVCGLVDTFQGGGSVLGIELEKSVTIPADVIYAVKFDETVDHDYSVNDIYGGVSHTPIN